MHIIITPAQLKIPVLQTMGMKFLLLGGKANWTGGKTIYTIDSAGQSIMERVDWQALFDNNIGLDGAEIYSPIVNEEYINALMPKDSDLFPGSFFDDPVYPENSYNKTYGEYFQLHQVAEDGYVLKFAPVIDSNNNARASYINPQKQTIYLPTDIQVRGWAKFFKGFITKGEMLYYKSIYQAAQATLDVD